MGELKYLLKRFWCWLTGGHRYADSNLQSYHFPKHCMTCFRNVCVKCGKSNVWAVSDKALYYDGEPLYEQFSWEGK